MSKAYVPLIVYVIVALLVPISINVVVRLLNRKYRSAAGTGASASADSFKTQSYEGGYPTEAMSGRFPVKFYLVAMLFVIFDVEAAAFYPWALNLRALGHYALLEMVAFLVVLAVGYAYVWKKGGFQWR